MVYSIGIDVGGTKVLGGVVDENGAVLTTARKDTPRQGGSALTSAIADIAKELLEEFPVTSVGVSAAGFVSSDRKTMLATPNIADWNGVNLETELSQLIGLRVVIENDANAAAWGEAKFGAGRNQDHMMMLTVGTGIGGGIVVNGSLYRGAFGIAAEFGHLRVVPEGHLCGCGARGCFEQYASGNALLRHAREAINASPEIARNLLSRGDGTVAGLTGQAITDAAREGDPVALAAFNTTGQWLGAGIASLSVLLDPSCVVIGGGVIDAGEILLAPTRESLQRNMPFAGKHPYPQIIAAALGNEAGLVGVADLARL
ncbi:MAG: ROK family glucokinase [Actinobacteria bacterium]|jgi:glucokinase|uniref:Glucokinase n=1 Tax=freshwater metagenome TaxID=449393 RepID=A0A6J7B0Z9_9ZZZZ|nr:ROK family glucokinase [Actinomycetota bacterium]MSY36270.1 ROK family glucokinase [Actinomycetota bacterium]MTA72866.1 ROK family glucokinase [Actinomycetota bacterium]MTB29544.1 ROK family glucokinase [Actinomycetota bacterium]MUH48931.1 ROK family glucokinase [Actinomycetota bacterium]